MQIGPTYHSNCDINTSTMELGFSVDTMSEVIQPVTVRMIESDSKQ